MRVVRETLRIANLPRSLEGATVAHLTDVHRCWSTSDALLKKAVRVAMEAKPDLILVTGDFVTENPKDIAPCAEILSPLKARLGVYFILGNHDYTTDAPAVLRALEGLGFQSLINRNVCLEGGLWVAGLDDDREGEPFFDRAFAGIPESATPIVLAHNPALAEMFSYLDCYSLSGHTHGGQVVLPFLTAYKIWLIGAKRYRAGWYDVGRARLYVNSGLGNVAVPFRLFAPPEVALFTLEPR